MYQPDWDINLKEGNAAEGWVYEVLHYSADTVEVKAPKPFLKYHDDRHVGPYVEYECRGRDGIWRPSGVATTKSTLSVFTFGSLPGGWMVDTNWLRRAARVAYADAACRREERDGSNPTRGVITTMSHLWSTREGEP